MFVSLEGNVFFVSVAVLLLSFAVQGALSFFSSTKTLEPTSVEDSNLKKLTNKFQLLALPPWLLAMFCDWLQGPYLYEAYRTYGFSREKISILFSIGFLASGITGVFAGTLTDKFGRRKSCIAYALLYIIGDLMMNINNFYILAFGRVFLGAGNAILFTSFDSWMVSEHFSRGLPGSLLGSTYSKFSFGNGLAAIIAGVVAKFAVDSFNPITPFNMATALLVVLVVFISMTWNENYGQKSSDNAEEQRSDAEQGGETDGNYVVLTDGEGEKKSMTVWQQMYYNPEIWMVGLVQSLFEGSMFGFVVVWTPCLPRAIAQGVAFATFMVGVMLGSRVFAWLRDSGMRVSMCVLSYLVVGALGFYFHVFTAKTAPEFGDDPADTLAPELHSYSLKTLLAFFVFEVACGMHFSAFYNLRATVLPEEGRATIVSLFQVPLNALVFVLSVYSGLLSASTFFSILTVQLLCAGLLVKIIDRRLKLKAGEFVNRSMAVASDAVAVLVVVGLSAVMLWK